MQPAMTPIAFCAIWAVFTTVVAAMLVRWNMREFSREYLRVGNHKPISAAWLTSVGFKLHSTYASVWSDSILLEVNHHGSECYVYSHCNDPNTPSIHCIRLPDCKSQCELRNLCRAIGVPLK